MDSRQLYGTVVRGRYRTEALISIYTLRDQFTMGEGVDVWNVEENVDEAKCQSQQEELRHKEPKVFLEYSSFFDLSSLNVYDG